jgi:hypothetical protein
VAAAFEHHRGVDGKGYPALDSMRAPHEIVRLVALANYVDRRRTLLRGAVDGADEALARAATLADVYFGRPALRHYVRALGVFPPGTTVQLSDRREGLVVAANPGDPRRPIVRILTGTADLPRVDLKQLDAVEDRHMLSIVRAVPPPMLVRPLDAEPEAPSLEPPPSELPSLRPLAGGLSVPPAARVSGLYSSVPRVRGPSSAPPEAAKSSPAIVAAPRVSAPPPITSSVPPAGAASSPEELERSYLKTLGSLEGVPRLVLSPAELGKLSLDHRAGFVLTFVDGASSIDTLLDASGLPRLELLRILAELVLAGAVVVQ